MNPRFALAVLAAASLLIAAVPADARQAAHKSAGQAKIGRSAPVLDVAAIPAYPVEETTGRRGGRAASPSTKGLRTADHSRRVREASPRASHGESGSGIVRSKKTGATARVSPRYSSTFQAYLDDIEAAGARVLFMGGYRGGPCAPPRHKHPCGAALDVCQLGRGVVDGRCGMPSPATVSAIAKRHGLTEGAIWCHNDFGHVEAGAAAGGCAGKGPRGLATMTGKIVPRPRAAAKKVRHPHVADRGAKRL